MYDVLVVITIFSSVFKHFLWRAGLNWRLVAVFIFWPSTIFCRIMVPRYDNAFNTATTCQNELENLSIDYRILETHAWYIYITLPLFLLHKDVFLYHNLSNLIFFSLSYRDYWLIGINQSAASMVIAWNAHVFWVRNRMLVYDY